MKKSHIIFILVILLSISIVDARRDMFWPENPKCFEDGSITFDIDAPYDNQIATRKIGVWAKYLGFEGEESYKLNGDWSKRNVANEIATFSSSKGSLNYSGDYEIRLIYTDNPICYPYNEKGRNCDMTLMVSDCIGYSKYDCDISNITIESCYTIGNYVYLNFSGLNKNQFKKLTKENFMYEIDGKKKLEANTRLPEGAEIEKTGEDSYLFKMNTENWGDIKSIVVYVDKCLNKEKVFCKVEVKKCNNCEVLKDGECEPKCKSDNICKIANCKDGVCSYLIKEDCCEEKKDCDDFLACTEDLCVDNKCVHTDIKCTASDDPCVVGVCEEPNGCKYISKPDCKTMEDVTGKAISEIGKEERPSFFKRLINWISSIFS